MLPKVFGADLNSLEACAMACVVYVRCTSVIATYMHRQFNFAEQLTVTCNICKQRICTDLNKV